MGLVYVILSICVAPLFISKYFIRKNEGNPDDDLRNKKKILKKEVIFSFRGL